MSVLTIDVSTNYLYLTEYAHIEATLYDNETKQTLSFIKSAAAGATATAPLRAGEFPGLSRKIYTVTVRLLDTRFRPVNGRVVIVSMINDRVTRVSIRR